MIDIHQHLLPPAVAEALARRRTGPRLAGGRLVAIDGTAAAHDPAAHDPGARAALVRADGLGAALVMLPALGTESLPRAEAEPLCAAWLEAAEALPRELRAWAHVPLDEPDPADVEEALGRGCVGLHLPARALADAAGAERVAPLLEACSRHAAPVLVHPGPASTPAIVAAAHELHAAWWTTRLAVRPALPGLRVAFAALAGLAPLHEEHASVRGLRLPVDPLLFLDTAGYGTRAVDAAIRAVGIDVLVHGSDRPDAAPAEPALGPAVRNALRAVNPARLLSPLEVAA